MGRSSEIEHGNKLADEAAKMRSAASQLHRAKQDLVRRNVQIETCMQAIIDKARRRRDDPAIGPLTVEACDGAIDAIRQLAHDLGIEGLT